MISIPDDIRAAMLTGSNKISTDDYRYLRHGLTPKDVAELCGVTVRTARRWEQDGCPAGYGRLLALVRKGDLGFIHPSFEGWSIDIRRGELVNSEGVVFTPGELNALPFRYALLSELMRKAGMKGGVGQHDYSNVTALPTAKAGD